MEQFSLPRKLAAEFLGTALLLATVVGSGIMAERLAGGNAAIALLGNTIPNITAGNAEQIQEASILGSQVGLPKMDVL